jgi:hypothetical protein
MSACTVSSIADLTRDLLERRGFCLHIRHSASDDITESLLTKASRLKADGERVLIVCADDVVASQYHLRRSAFPELSEENIMTMRELCLRVLTRAVDHQTLDRGPRILDDNEYDVLLEDLKTSGVKPRRLREMLKFFYRSLSHHASENGGEREDWLLTVEERAVYALLKENLRVRRAVLPCEMASLACRGLLDAALANAPDAAPDNAVGVAGVADTPGTPATADITSIADIAIIDGYDTLSETSQYLLDTLFPNRLIVAGSTPSTQSFAEPYPNPQGFFSFGDTHADVDFVELAPVRPPVEEARSVYVDPAAEFAGVATMIDDHLAAGVLPRDILVAVPNGMWGRRVIAALAQRGLHATLDEGVLKIGGDPRDTKRGKKLRLATFLRLFLNPRDLVSLRSWLGFGDWLLHSDAFLDLMAFARDQRLDMADALEELRKQPASQRPFASFAKFEGPLAELDELRQACVGISKTEAIALFDRHEMPLDERMIEMLGSDPKRADIENLARRAFDHTPSWEGNSLLVAPYQRCRGRHARVTFLMGCVNGFLPSLDAVDDRYTIDHRSSALSREQRMFDGLKATASEKLVYSYFQNDLIENAEVLNMQTTRLFVKDAVRYAKVAPSVFLLSQADPPSGLRDKIGASPKEHTQNERSHL